MKAQHILIAVFIALMALVSCSDQWCDPAVQPCRMSADKSTTVMVKWLPSVAQDDTPTPEGTEIATEAATEVSAEATAEATQDADVVIIIEQPTDETPPDTTTINNGFSFEQVALSFFAFLLSIFVGIRMFVVPILKANVELAKDAGKLVPQETFDKMIGITEGLQRIAEVVTPNFQGDDEGLRRLRAEFQDLKLLLFPEQPPTQPPVG